MIPSGEVRSKISLPLECGRPAGDLKINRIANDKLECELGYDFGDFFRSSLIRAAIFR